MFTPRYRGLSKTREPIPIPTTTHRPLPRQASSLANPARGHQDHPPRYALSTLPSQQKVISIDRSTENASKVSSQKRVITLEKAIPGGKTLEGRIAKPASTEPQDFGSTVLPAGDLRHLLVKGTNQVKREGEYWDEPIQSIGKRLRPDRNGQGTLELTESHSNSLHVDPYQAPESKPSCLLYPAGCQCKVLSEHTTYHHDFYSTIPPSTH